MRLQREQNVTFCPVLALRDYLQIKPYHTLTFFAKSDGQPVPRHFVAGSLSKLTSLIGLDNHVDTTHSLRAGRASDLAEAGVADAVIRTAGRWSSAAFKCYLRFELLPPPVLA